MTHSKKILISLCSYTAVMLIVLTFTVGKANAGIISSIIKNFSDDVAKHAVKNYGDDVAKGLVKSYGDDVAKGLAKNYGDDVAKGLAKSYGDDVARGLAKSYGDDVARGLAKNYGDDVARRVASNYSDDVLRYAAREGAEKAGKSVAGEATAKIIGAFGKAAPSLALATVILTGTSAVAEAVAKPIGKIMNVSAESLVPVIQPSINVIIVALLLYIVIKLAMRIKHTHKMHKLKEEKLKSATLD